MIATHPQHGAEEIDDIIHNIDAAARVALEDVSLADVELRKAAPVDLQKFDA